MAPKNVKTYSKEQAREIFRRAFGDGSFRLTGHCRGRMNERGVDVNDLLEHSKMGLVFDPPEADITTGNLKYTIERREPFLTSGI